MTTQRVLSASDRKILNGLGQIERKIRFGDFLGTLRDDLDLSAIGGIAGYAELELATQPTHQDTIVIGRNTYECINTATGTVVADDANIAVVRGANAAAFLANIIAAINRRAAAAHATVTKADTTTPAVGVGSESVYAFASGTKLCIRPAVIPGSTVKPAGADVAFITLSDTLSASVGWNVADLGKLGLDPFEGRMAGVKFSVTTAMILSGRAQFETAFDVRSILVDVRDSNGKKKQVLDDAFTFSGKVVTATLAGAGVASKTQNLSAFLPATADKTFNWQHNFGVAVDVATLKAVKAAAMAGGALTCTVNSIAANGTRTALVTGADLAGGTAQVPFDIPGLSVPFPILSTEGLEILLIGGTSLSAPTGVTFQATYHEDVHSLANTDVVTIIAIG